MNMNGCLNILWHFPFFGFLFALFYALFGAILCCTVILYPVGLGFFQIARFLLTPFSSALVTRRELNLVRPEERSTAAAAYSTVITILYFPFGLIAAAGALFAMIGEFLSIIGIPCGIVWFKALPAIFMPVDKVCVPKAVADEIARIKAGDTVRRYKGETEEPETHSAERHSTDNFSEPLPAVPQVRQYDDDKLHGIIANPEMYKASLVDDCRRELEIRSKGAALMPKIEAYDDAGLREVLANPQMYSDEVLYCCQKVDAERRRIVRERQEREAELARLRREQEEKAAAEHRAAAWKKQRPYVFAAIAVLILSSAGIWRYSYHQEQARLEQERLEHERIRIEQVRIANQQRAEEQRIAEQKRAEEQRLAEQKRIEVERQQQEAKKILADKNYRRSVGAYIVGDYHEKLEGIVFYVDNTYKHGKVISISHNTDGSEYGKNWEDTIEWCKSLGGKWRLPTIHEWELIYTQVYKQSIDTEYSLDIKRGSTFVKSAYWSSSKSKNDEKSNWTFRFDIGCRDGCYHNYCLYARVVSSF